MTVSPKLMDAYHEADYVVFAEPEFVLKIGEPSSRLDALLEEEGATTAAFLTAANPRSKPQSAAQNASALSALDQLVAAAGYPWRAGEGREPDGSWVEPSRLVIGIYRENAEALGRLFGQNAIVFIEKGAPPELLVLA
jgi:glycine/D-amino acid oxidase-like deaminating enzyme